MADIPSVEQRRLNSFSRLQADLTGLRRSHQDLRTEMNQRFNALDTRFDTLEARLETMIEEMRRFFGRYEYIDVERK
jgi:hypothetical protein